MTLGISVEPPVNDNTSLEMKVSICICTRNRNLELHRALKSIQDTAYPVHEVIVSDDSTNGRTRDMVCTEFPGVVYLPGPQKGLSANRNNALRSVSGTHVLFLDDDAALGSNFLECIHRYLKKYGMSRDVNKIIVTGAENNFGSLIFPNDQGFLGFQTRTYHGVQRLKTIVINSTVFPVNLFSDTQFDEHLIYGYEEVDLATRAVGQGYEIQFCSTAVNFHYPSQVNREYYAPFTDAARLYVTFKRYRYTERRPLKAAVFLILGFSHHLLHNIRKKSGGGVQSTLRTWNMAFRLIFHAN